MTHNDESYLIGDGTDSVYGEGGIHDVAKELKNALNSYGIDVIDASIIDVHPDAQLQETIDNRVKALQKKQQAQAEQETAKVEAETALIKAQNEADIILAKAKAEADANREIAASITDNLIKMKEMEARMEHGWITIQGSDSIVVKE